MPFVWLKIIVLFASVLLALKLTLFPKLNVQKPVVALPDFVITQPFAKLLPRGPYANVPNILLQIRLVKAVVLRVSVPMEMVTALLTLSVLVAVVLIHVKMLVVPIPNVRWSIVSPCVLVPSVFNLLVNLPRKAVLVLYPTAAPMPIVAEKFAIMENVVLSVVKIMTALWEKNVCKMSVQSHV